MTTALVIPSNRMCGIMRFIEAWGLKEKSAPWAEICVVEDHQTKDFTLPNHITHFCWEDIENKLGKEEAWKFISKKDSAIRIFGFLEMAKKGHKFIFTLDDDCYPGSNQDPIDFHGKHMGNLCDTPRWTTSVINMPTRGFPYENIMENKKVRQMEVKVSMGLWQNVPDYDSVQQLMHMRDCSKEYGYAEDRPFNPTTYTRLMPHHQYFPFCGMNFAFDVDVLPLMYFPLMGENSPYQRFDDIWCGLVLKKGLDHLNMSISVGEPFVKHIRASNAFDNLIKEAKGIKANETYWQEIDKIVVPRNFSPASTALFICKGLEGSREEYVRETWASGFSSWIDECRRIL